MKMSNFPTNDLLRRKLQTILTIATLTLSVASTLFFLLFSSRLGLNTTSAEGTLTLGINSILSTFSFFIGVLVFAVGAVLTSFIAFLMMAQRTRDFGLIKAAGCPNNLVAGYFMTELLTITLAGSGLGVVLGFLMDFGVSNRVFSSYTLPNLWFGPVVFVAFFVLSFVFGLWPVVKVSKMTPAKALSPIEYNGLTVVSKRKSMSRSRLAWRIASRSMYRRQKSSIRLVVLLSIVFVLLTISVAGGIIAKNTTTSWVQNTLNSDTIAVATNKMGNQYEQLLSKFSGGSIDANFNYSESNLAIPQSVITQLSHSSSVTLVDSRLVLSEHVSEIDNFTVNPDTEAISSVGGNRQGNSIVVGVNPDTLDSTWSLKGDFLTTNSSLEAVVGDSIAQTLYSPDPSLNIKQSNPFVQGIEFDNNTFQIVGVCVDPLNNGLVTYVPIDTLMNTTGIANPNLLLVQLKDPSSTTITHFKTLVQSIDPNLNVFSMNNALQEDTDFLASTWQTIMILPLFNLASAAICLVGYMMLTVDEQHQEFGILRAVGAKPKFIVLIMAIQSVILLLSSIGIGISFGTIITLLILIPQPIVTVFTILEISGWLLAALLSMFLLSLYPAFRLARSSILKIVT